MPPAGQVLPCEDYSVEKPTVIEKFNAVINSPQFIFSALWFIWLTTGTIFYSYDLDIGWAKGFYMAVNVGYSIGWYVYIVSGFIIVSLTRICAGNGAGEIYLNKVIRPLSGFRCFLYSVDHLLLRQR